MSLGQTASAPAAACETAVRASSSSVASLSTWSPSSTPQWPCEVYSQRQTSVSSTSAGLASRSARSARWMTPSSSQAPEPSASFSSGIPNRITAFTPSASRLVGLGGQVVDREAAERGQLGVRLGRRPDEERQDEVVEVEPRLAHERPQAVAAAEPAQTRDRERAHTNNLRAPTRASPPKTAPSATSQRPSRSTSPQGLRS